VLIKVEEDMTYCTVRTACVCVPVAADKVTMYTVRWLGTSCYAQARGALPYL
jgi:hypothetical protein